VEWQRYSGGAHGYLRRDLRTSGVGNAVVITLPEDDEVAAELYRPGTPRAMLATLAESWQPERAAWTSNGLRSMQQSKPSDPVVCWLTYLGSPRRIVNDRLPATAEVEPFSAAR